MSNRGRIQIDRGVFEHEAFDREPFSQREAWIWLLCEAAWAPRDRRNGCVQRGELCHSQRFMARTWGWHDTRVARFLNKLEARGMIQRTNSAPIAHSPYRITILNYNKYQLKLADEQRTNSAQTATSLKKKESKESSSKALAPYDLQARAQLNYPWQNEERNGHDIPKTRGSATAAVWRMLRDGIRPPPKPRLSL